MSKNNNFVKEKIERSSIEGESSVRELNYHIPPKIPHDIPKDNFRKMLKSNNAVLVQKGNRVIGIITSANLL